MYFAKYARVNVLCRLFMTGVQSSFFSIRISLPNLAGYLIDIKDFPLRGRTQVSSVTCKDTCHYTYSTYIDCIDRSSTSIPIEMK